MPKRQPAASPDAPADERDLDILIKEYDTLKDLVIHAESSAQSMFNFYLTLVSTLVAVLLLLLQLADPSQVLEGTQVMLSLLLFFFAGIGSIYLSALTGRYAHIARYAYGLDALRRHLIETYHTPVPDAYREFVSRRGQQAQVHPGLHWLFPTGTFQFCMAVINSLALVLGVGFLLNAGGGLAALAWQSALTGLIVFLVTFTLYNVYSHMLIHRLTSRLNVQINTLSEQRFVAGRQ